MNKHITSFINMAAVSLILLPTFGSLRNATLN